MDLFTRKAGIPAALLAVFLTAPLTCLAQQDERSWSLGVALGHGERDNPLISGESIDINAVIDFSWYGERFFFDNGDLGFTLKEENVWSVNLVSTFNNERTYYNYLSGKTFGLDTILERSFGADFIHGLNDPRDPEVGDHVPPNLTAEETSAFVNLNTELPDRDYAFNGGLEFLYISPWGDLQAQALTDMSSTHNGQEAWLSWSKPWYTRNSQLTLTLGLEWKSHDLVGYYYGVTPDESFPGREEYDGGSGVNRFVRLAGRHRLSDSWSLVGMVEREFLSSAIAGSPIVDRDNVDTFFVGLFYNF